MPKDKLGAVCCKKFGGTRIAGDALTRCVFRGPQTYCCGCQAVIAVKWLLSGEQRTQMAKDGYSKEQILEVNRALLLTELEIQAGTF